MSWDKRDPAFQAYSTWHLKQLAKLKGKVGRSAKAELKARDMTGGSR